MEQPIGGGEGGRGFRSPIPQGAELKKSFKDAFDIICDFRTHIFCPQTTQKLRGTMKQYRLNNCLLMHCHKSIRDTLDSVIIAKRFASANEQLKGHFGQFE